MDNTLPSSEIPSSSTSPCVSVLNTKHCNNKECQCGWNTPPPTPILLSPDPQILLKKENPFGLLEQNRKTIIEKLTALSKIKSQEAHRQFLINRPALKKMNRCPTCNCFCLKRKSDEMTERTEEINSLINNSLPPQMEINGFKIPNDAWTKSVLNGNNPSSLRILHIALVPPGHSSKKIKLGLKLNPSEIDVKPTTIC